MTDNEWDMTEDTGILITARLKSTRLPRKAIKPINGKPMLEHLVRRLQQSRFGDRIIVCTSEYSQDDDLVHLANSLGVDYFRGDPDDVLARLNAAATNFGLEHVISCTADNPFVDPVWIDRLMQFHIENDHDFSRTEGLPFGCFAYALERDAIQRACDIKDEIDTEVWGGYFTESGLFSNGVLEIDDPLFRRPEYRLTVDTPDDFELVTRIFDELGDRGIPFPLSEIIELLDTRPELRSINDKVAQAKAKAVKFKDGAV